MGETRQLRVYMLCVACSACLVRIMMTISENFNLMTVMPCLESLACDAVSLWSSCWS